MNTSTQNEAGTFLTFCLSNEVYALRVHQVEETIGMIGVTPVPTSPDWVRGVINLRGKILSLIDLRTRMGMERIPDSNHTCIIIVHAPYDGQTTCFGMVVDRISEVITLSDEQIADQGNIDATGDHPFVQSIATYDSDLLLIIDLQAVIQSNHSRSKVEIHA